VCGRERVSESYQLAIYQLAIKSSVKRTRPRGEKLAKWIYDSENVSCEGWCFFIHTRPIRPVTNESILSAFSGSGREKRVFNWNPIFFLPHRCRPPDPNFRLPIREKLYRWRILTLHVRFTKRRQYDFFFFFLLTWRPSANPQC